MKKLAFILSVALLIGIAWRGASFGFTQTSNLDVQFNILSACNVSATSGVLTFPDVNDTTTGTLTETAAIQFTVNCTVGTPWTVTDNRSGVANGLVTDFTVELCHDIDPLDIVPVTVHYAPNAGTGVGADQAISITAEIAEADYVGKRPGTYTNLAVLTVTY